SLHTITFVRIAEWQDHFADVDPFAISFLLLQMRKSDASHAAAIAGGIAAGADNEMLGHTAMLEANAQRTTLNVQSRIQNFYGMQEPRNGANGMSDIEGKAARAAVTECGKRRSFNSKSALIPRRTLVSYRKLFCKCLQRSHCGRIRKCRFG